MLHIWIWSGKQWLRYYNAPAGINILQSSKISVCPNPATDKITIEIAAGLASSQLSIINLNGEEGRHVKLPEA